MALVSRLTNYAALGVPTINGVPIGEAGVFDTSGDDFRYTPTKEEVEHCLRIYTDSLPKGRLWEAFGVQGTINYAFAYAVGSMIAIVFAYLNYLRRELDPNTTVDFINEWEESVGLPDPCSVKSGLDLESRRRQVILRWRRTPIVLATEIEQAVFDLTGYEIKVRPNRISGGLDSATLDAPIEGGANKFIFDVYVNFDSSGGLGSGGLDETPLDAPALYPYFVECIINQLKPANVLVFYHYSDVEYNSVT